MKTTYQSRTMLTQIDIKDDSIVVNILSKFILPILMVFGFYVHSHGDYTPGGGFQAGVIFSCVLCLCYFLKITTKRLTCKILTHISMAGFVFYVGTGLLGFLTTGHFLNFTFLPFEYYNARGVFIVEFGIALVVFSSISRIFTVLLYVLENKE